MDIHREPSQPPETQIRSSRKRAATPLFDQDIMEEMAPTTAALKRRRLADELERKRRGEPSPSPPPAPALVVKKEEPKTPAKTPPKRSRKIKEATPDLVEEARKRREEEEAIVKAEREAVEARFDGMDISEIRADVQIVEIEVKRSKPPPRRVNTADESERWDDKWNGRKNFKRFRRRGAGDNVRARGLDKVIVPLEEVKTKDYGIGDDYWEVGDPNQRKKRKGKGKEMDTQTQNESGQSSRPQSHAAKIIANEISDDDDTPISRPSVPRSQARASIPVDPDQNSDVEIVERPEVAAKSKVTASASRTSQSQSQRLTEKSQNSVLASPKKRVAPTALSKPAPAKKAKTALRAPREDSDDDSDDALKFKFKKKEVKER
jgi:nijmegen breakage syndrome protein 1